MEIKEITFQARKKGQSQRWVYEHLVRDRYHISYATFNNYLARSARREIRELENRDISPASQLCINF
jgi:hypothetical protein